MRRIFVRFLFFKCVFLMLISIFSIDGSLAETRGTVLYHRHDVSIVSAAEYISEFISEKIDAEVVKIALSAESLNKMILIGELPIFDFLSIISWDSYLDYLTTDPRSPTHDAIQPMGKNQPFPGIDWSFKKRSTHDRSRAVWVAIGWISFEEFENVRGPGECNPEKSWNRKQCLEKHSDDYYVVHMRVGHAGWHVRGFAMVNSDIIYGSDYYDLGISMRVADALASSEFSELMRDHFIVVPYDSVRARRTVVFEIYEPRGGSTVPLQTSTGDPVPDTLETNDDEHNSCGGKSAACPNFRWPEDLNWTRLDEINWSEIRWRLGR